MYLCYWEMRLLCFILGKIPVNWQSFERVAAFFLLYLQKKYSVILTPGPSAAANSKGLTVFISEMHWEMMHVDVDQQEFPAWTVFGATRRSTTKKLKPLLKSAIQISRMGKGL